ncbi:hypothetical protein PCPL58_p5049 (plasmid) [Pseudomonas cerasi]|nr:hypothetical protein PCPL58_p5049 [Pseudomonas cerasi]
MFYPAVTTVLALVLVPPTPLRVADSPLTTDVFVTGMDRVERMIPLIKVTGYKIGASANLRRVS